MKRFLRIILYGLGVAAFILLLGPFLVPIPPLENALPPEDLADPDSLFSEINGIKIHYKMRGNGQPALVLLHGFAASLFSWREVMIPLSGHGQIIAYDRPAFGLTERPLHWNGENPYSSEAQVELAIALLDRMGLEKAVLVGNSAGGSLAILIALRHPERVQSLVLVDPAVYLSSGAPNWIRLISNTPQARRLGPLFVRSIQNWGLDFARQAWHDPSKITPDIWAGYTRPLQAMDWDKALWELNVSNHPSDLASHLGEIQIPTLVITGDDDRIVPTEQSVRLASELPNARLVIIPNCGHAPQEECPAEFLQAVDAFLAEQMSQ